MAEGDPRVLVDDGQRDGRGDLGVVDLADASLNLAEELEPPRGLVLGAYRGESPAVAAVDLVEGRRVQGRRGVVPPLVMLPSRVDERLPDRLVAGQRGTSSDQAKTATPATAATRPAASSGGASAGARAGTTTAGGPAGGCPPRIALYLRAKPPSMRTAVRVPWRASSGKSFPGRGGCGGRPPAAAAAPRAATGPGRWPRGRCRREGGR